MKDFLGETNMVDALSEWTERLYAIGSIIAELGAHETVDLSLYTDALGGIIRDYSKAIGKVLDATSVKISGALGGDNNSLEAIELGMAFEAAANGKFRSHSGRIEDIESVLSKNQAAIEKSQLILSEAANLRRKLAELRDDEAAREGGQ